MNNYRQYPRDLWGNEVVVQGKCRERDGRDGKCQNNVGLEPMENSSVERVIIWEKDAFYDS